VSQPIEVAPDAVRETAARLAETAYRIACGTRGSPGLTASAPDWQTASALTALRDAVETDLSCVGTRTADAAARLRQAAESYEAADERAARRLSAGW
jgi:hypothetical protein